MHHAHNTLKYEIATLRNACGEWPLTDHSEYFQERSFKSVNLTYFDCLRI
jgi:hypothetical protein